VGAFAASGGAAAIAAAVGGTEAATAAAATVTASAIGSVVGFGSAILATFGITAAVAVQGTYSEMEGCLYDIGKSIDEVIVQRHFLHSALGEARENILSQVIDLTALHDMAAVTELLKTPLFKEQLQICLDSTASTITALVKLLQAVTKSENHYIAELMPLVSTLSAKSHHACNVM